MAMRTPSLQNDSLVGINREIGSQFDDVKTVAENIESVVTVADHINNVDTVATNIVDVHAVGGSIVDVRTVATNINNVVTVGQDIANVNTVAANVGNIDMIVTEVLPNINEIANASANAAIATTKANEAATSAANALVSEQNAKASELAAGVSENNAATSEAVAIAKATEASASETAATTQAGIAATKANEASASATAARNSELAAAAMLDAFDDRYLGSFTVDPTTDNDGQPLLDGALYFNTSENVLKVYDVGTATWYTIPQTLLSSLLDVQLTSVATGDILNWNGTKWVNTSSVREHIADTSNPHSVTKAQVGLGSVDNTADSTKNVLSATKLTTARAITLTGDVTGTVNFDGSAGVSITTAVGDNTHSHDNSTITSVDWSKISSKPGPVVTVTLTGDVTGTANATLTDLSNGTVSVATTIAANSVALGTDTTGNYVANVTAGTYVTKSGTVGEGWSPTINVDATSTNTASKVVARDASGNFAAGTITAALAGNAATATKLATARNISLSGDVSGTVSFDGSGAVDITTTVADDSHLHAFTNLTSKPTTVSGYGITDAYTKTEADSALSLKAPLASPALTGTPTTPTAVIGTNTTQIASTAYVKAEISNATYSKTQLNAGQLDNRYYTETELNSGVLDTRYYTEAEIDTKLAAQNDASEIVVVPTGNLASTNVQAALVELQADINNRYTKSETDTLLAGKVDDSEIASVNLLRADKYLASQNIANMTYVSGDLAKIQYNTATDVDYETLGYTSGNLTSINHYVGSVLKGTTTLSYTAGNLTSAVFVGV